jgi:hypothetical protein
MSGLLKPMTLPGAGCYWRVVIGCPLDAALQRSRHGKSIKATQQMLPLNCARSTKAKQSE